MSLSTPPPAASEPGWDECLALLDELPALPVASRIEVTERLVRNPSPGIRERALRVGAAVFSDERLVAYLRDDVDAVARNAGLEILKMRGRRSLPVALDLLGDEDDDVVLQAVLLLDHLEDPRALEPLRGMLDHRDPNVVQAAIGAIGRLGDERVVPDLLELLSSDPWIQIAAVEALGNLRSPRAVPALLDLLPDLMTGPIAAEALARIGGPRAYRALAEHYLRFGEETDTEEILELAAHVAEGLSKPPPRLGELPGRLARELDGEAAEVREAAARCLLVAGPDGPDREALEVLLDSRMPAASLPACLARRADLTEALLAREGKARSWGLLLAGRHVGAVAAETVVEALAATELPGQLEPALAASSALPDEPAGRALVDLFLRLPAEHRPAVGTRIEGRPEAVAAALAERRETPDAETRLALGVYLGEGPEEVAEAASGLDHPARLELLAQLAERPEVLRRLPWSEWLAERPDLYADRAAEIAARLGSRELLETLRPHLAERPSPQLLHAVAELGDRKSVPHLLAILDSEPTLAAPAVESLGRIGGPEARERLRELAAGGEASGDGTGAPLERLAYRALARCATSEDHSFFRAAASHPDWYVRLAAAEVLARFTGPDNLAALTRLAADPVAAVAERALAALQD